MTLAIATPAAKPRTRKPKPPPQPFTLAHFRAWAGDLILDTGQSWRPEPFFEAFVEDVFSGCPECWLVVPEGNGKTTSLSGLALYHCEFRPHAAVPVAASSREQAEILYRQAEGFVLRSPRMYESLHSNIQAAKGKRKTDVPRFLCLEGYRRINHFEGGRIQVFAADDRTGDGVLPTLGIIDEPHRQRDLSLYRTWAGKLDKRGGQIAAISTRGEPGSEFETALERIRRTSGEVIRRGSFVRAKSPRLVLHEWAVPEAGDVHDFVLVKSANPFRGITVASLKEKYHSPTMTEDHWLRFVCNRPARGSTAAVQEAEWAKAGTPPSLIPPGEAIWLGLDVAWKWDTTACVPFWMPEFTRRIFGPASILVPPRDGTSMDPTRIEVALTELHARNPIHTVVMDTSRAEQLATWIATDIGATVIDRGQTNAFAVEDYELFMEALRSGWLRHSGDVGLTSHVLNAVAKVLPYGDARFDRPSQTRDAAEQDRRVIDGLSAAAMVHTAAVRAAMTPVEASQPEILMGRSW